MNFFNIKLHNTTLKREIVSGISTFISMSYILSLNPKLLGQIGMDYNGVFVATIIASVLTTLISAFYTKMPLAYAPAVSYNICILPMLMKLGPGKWQLMLLATYLSGVIMIAIVITGMYDRINRQIPLFIKESIVAGIGMAVVLTGTSTLHIVEKLNGRVSLSVFRREVAYCFIALGIVFLLKKRKKRYAITVGVIFTYALIVIAQVGINLYRHEFSASQLFGTGPIWTMDIQGLFSVAYHFPNSGVLRGSGKQLFELFMITFAMTATHYFDACGTGTATTDEIRKNDVNFDPDAVKKTVLVNGIGGLLSGCAGTSSVTTYAESMTGIDAGAKTGLSAIVVCIGFVLSLFLAPFYQMMSEYVVAPAMLYVGYLFFIRIKKIEFHDRCEKIVAAFVILYSGITFQIGYAGIWGMLLHMGLKLITGRRREIKKSWPVVAVLSLLCAIVKWNS